MKQFIILIGILPFLLVFLMQYSLEQQNHHRLTLLQQAVYTAKEQAKQDGYFTKENLDTLKANILSNFDLMENEILIQATTIPRYRVNSFDERELIHYKVEVPLNKIMAGGKLFGISDDDNCSMYKIESYTASERLSP